MADAHKLVKRKPSLDKSSRISKPQEIAPGTSRVCRGLIDFSLSKGKFCKSRAAAAAVGADGAFFGGKG